MFLWIALALAGEPVAPEATPTAAPAPAVHRVMAERFDLANTAREAVIAGNLDGVHEAAVALSKLGEEAEEQPEFAKDLDMFTRAARGATSIPDAASAVAELTIACARCHEQTHGGPALHTREVPSQSWSADTQMTQHAWATTWMWLGLLKPDRAAWDRGAQELSSRMPPVASTPTMEADDSANKQLRKLGASALKAADGPDQAALYAQLLSTCARCHMRRESE